MTNPLERCRRMKTTLESAQGYLRTFGDMVAEIAKDPFTEAPSKGVLEAVALTQEGEDAIRRALLIIDDFHQRLDTPENRESIGIVVDESAQT